MTFDPSEKLIELFKKHMTIPMDLTDEEVLDYIHHNLEYCNWYMMSGGRAPRKPSNDGEIHIGEDWAYKGHFCPLNIFHGQDEAMRKVERDFITYLCNVQSYVIVQITDAIQRMMVMKIVPESFQVQRKWVRILPPRVHGLSRKICESDETPRIFSEAKYGRFVEFTL